MGDKRRENPAYAEDVDIMIVEYLIHSTTKACIDDFLSKNGRDPIVQPSQSVLTQIHILNDFLVIHKAKYQLTELDEEVRLWLELLELVVFISYRKAEPSTLFSTQLQHTANSKHVERRSYWFEVRRDISSVTQKEHAIYSTWGKVGGSGTWSNLPLPEPAKDLSSISPLFFAISARIASFIEQGISEKWIELATQFMLHTALESCLANQEGGNIGDLLALAFAWGWIPSSYWNEFNDSEGTSSVQTELMINAIFEDKDGRGARENQAWQEARLKCLSLFDVSGPSRPSTDNFQGQLEKVALEHPIQEFERELIEFSREMWKFCRKPLLVQIEEGEVEGVPQHEFEDFKKRIFAPN